MTRLLQLRSYLAAAIVAVSFMAAPVAMADETVALKNALYGAGYNITNVTPQMDEATRNALTRFQRDNGLTASGELDEATKEALGMVSVQVARAGTGSNSSGSGAGSSAGNAGDAPAEPEAQNEEDAEEEDDGGWSFF